MRIDFAARFQDPANFELAQKLARKQAMDTVFVDGFGSVPGAELWDTITEALGKVVWADKDECVINGPAEARECIEALAGEDWFISERFEYSSPGELTEELECHESWFLWLLADYEEKRK